MSSTEERHAGKKDAKDNDNQDRLITGTGTPAEEREEERARQLDL